VFPSTATCFACTASCSCRGAGTAWCVCVQRGGSAHLACRRLDAVLTRVCTLVHAPTPQVSDYMPRGDLLQLLRSGHRVTKRRVAQFALDTALGVLHLHRHGVVHRDLACRNLLLTERLVVNVADFGHARSVRDGSGSKFTNSNVGPVRWMARECLEQRKYSKASDVYSFGVVLFELVTRGSTPWGPCTLPGG